MKRQVIAINKERLGFGWGGGEGGVGWIYMKYARRQSCLHDMISLIELYSEPVWATDYLYMIYNSDSLRK